MPRFSCTGHAVGLFLTAVLYPDSRDSLCECHNVKNVKQLSRYICIINLFIDYDSDVIICYVSIYGLVCVLFNRVPTTIRLPQGKSQRDDYCECRHWSMVHLPWAYRINLLPTGLVGLLLVGLLLGGL